MTKNVKAITRLIVLASLAAAAACDAQKSRNPLSPTVAGPIAGVSITAPVPAAPKDGEEVLNTDPIRLVIGNARSNGERPFWYVVEVASDANFNTKVYVNPHVIPLPGDQTMVVVDTNLNVEATYYWRVRADDGANASDYSATLRFAVVVPVSIAAPGPVSPVGGQTTPITTPTLTVNNGAVAGRAGTVQYVFQVARDQAFTNMVATATAERSAGSTTSVVTPELPGSTLLYWRVYGTNGTVTSSMSAVQSFRTPAGAGDGGGGGGGGGGGSSTPGCVNGVLSDPRAYFFALIGRTEGSPAGDWYTVLQRSGLPAGPPAGVKVPANAPNYGITQQVDSSGHLRGRIFLPTDAPDQYGYYIYQVDVLSDASASSWVWRPLGGPPYAPRACK